MAIPSEQAIRDFLGLYPTIQNFLGLYPTHTFDVYELNEAQLDTFISLDSIKYFDQCLSDELATLEHHLEQTRADLNASLDIVQIRRDAVTILLDAFNAGVVAAGGRLPAIQQAVTEVDTYNGGENDEGNAPLSLVGLVLNDK